MLAVSDPEAAIDFYRRAFGAHLRWQIGEPAEVAGLSVGNAEFFLARANPPVTAPPGAVGHTTVRIELFVDNPRAVHAQAVAAGAATRSVVQEHVHEMIGGRTLRMLQGSVVDLDGHVWLIGKFLEGVAGSDSRSEPGPD